MGNNFVQLSVHLSETLLAHKHCILPIAFQTYRGLLKVEILRDPVS